MEYSGNQKLFRTLLRLHQTGGSGIVRLEHGTAKKQIAVSRGHLAFAESNVQEEHLARVLVRLNLLPKSSLPNITAMMKTGKTAVQAISACARLDSGVLERGAEEQAITIMASLVSWNDAPLRFYSGEEFINRGLDLDLRLPEFILTGVRRAAEKRTTFRLGPLEGMMLSAVDANRGYALTLPLQPAEAYVYSLIQNPIPAQHVGHLLGAGNDDTSDILVLRLLLLGLATLERQELAVPAQSDPREDLAALERRLDELGRSYETMDYYQILSLPPDATDAQIKASYYDLAKQYHPDRFASGGRDVRRSAERLFTFITSAYTTLSTPASRGAYDEQRLKSSSQLEAALQARAPIDVEKERTADTLFRAGQAALAREDFRKAVTLLRECVWLRPDVARFRRYLGFAEAEVPALRKDAEQSLLKAIELDRMEIDSYMALGRLYLKVDLPRRAEAQFLEVLRWDPNNTAAQHQLDLLAETKRTKR
jgi:tetratricopeptide (TPR) repeat protein